MKPTEILKSEHRVIEVVLRVLDTMASRAEEEKVLDGESAKQTIDFFKNFADRCHHAKEEGLLFPWMEAHGFPREGGPTGVMFSEHEQGRTHIQNMSQSIDPASQGDAEALDRFINNARAYIYMLSEHIQKEDHCLFSMADQAMGEEDQQQLMQNFDHTEKEEVGAGVHERYLELARTLANKYQVDFENLNSEISPSGCHH